MSHGEALREYVGAFVDALADSGVRDAVVCPGSRSTPLAILLRRHPEIRTWVHLDERSAAFFALGMAKARRSPVAIVATSGTATANFFPAVVEAFYGRVPLVVLTADRPPELREVGALQTIDQVRLYGGQVKWFQEMLLPEVGLQRHSRAVAARAVALASAAPQGPVHVNFPFREPLMPAIGAPSPVVTPTVIRGAQTLDRRTVEALATTLAEARRGVIVCGPQDDPDFPVAVAELAKVLGWPVLADLLSQVRCGPHAKDNVITAYDLFLRDPSVVSSLEADWIVRFGATPVSKPLQSYLERSPARQIVVDVGGWPDQSLVASELIWADATALCHAVATTVSASAPDPDWLPRWRALDAGTVHALNAALAKEAQLSEPGVFAALAEALPAESVLMLGNSMPVRDADTIFPSLDCTVRTLANRGASGIDGVVSTALGVATVAHPVVLVLGDLSFYHDLNGLLAAKLHHLSATIIVLNNDGGGIFSFLPQAEQAEHFEELFGTPHGVDFGPVAQMYGVEYRVVASARDLADTIRRSVHLPGVRVLEVRTERAANVAVHRRLVAAALDAVSLHRR